MNKMKLIRQHLGVTQKALGDALGCVQGCIVAYERDRPMPQKRAEKLIEFAASKGCILDFNHVYGNRPLPRWVAIDFDDSIGAEEIPAGADSPSEQGHG